MKDCIVFATKICITTNIDLQLDFLYINLFVFRILFRTLNHHYDYVYDWTMLKQKTHQGQPNPAILLGQAESRNDRDKEKEKQGLKPMISD